MEPALASSSPEISLSVWRLSLARIVTSCRAGRFGEGGQCYPGTELVSGTGLRGQNLNILVSVLNGAARNSEIFWPESEPGNVLISWQELPPGSVLISWQELPP